MQVLGSISGRGTKFHMTHLKILHATAKTWHSQIDKENKYLKKKKKRTRNRQCSRRWASVGWGNSKSRVLASWAQARAVESNWRPSALAE